MVRARQAGAASHAGLARASEPWAARSVAAPILRDARAHNLCVSCLTVGALLRMRTEQAKTLLRRHLAGRCHDHRASQISSTTLSASPVLGEIGRRSFCASAMNWGRLRWRWASRESHALRQHRLRGNERPADLRQRQRRMRSCCCRRASLGAVSTHNRHGQHVRRNRGRQAITGRSCDPHPPAECCSGSAIAIRLAAMDRDALLSCPDSPRPAGCARRRCSRCAGWCRIRAHAGEAHMDCDLALSSAIV